MALLTIAELVATAVVDVRQPVNNELLEILRQLGSVLVVRPKSLMSQANH